MEFMDEPMAIRAFLGKNVGQFCDNCLGHVLGIPAEEVKTTVFADARDFARIYGYCRRCRQQKAVTAALRVA